MRHELLEDKGILIVRPENGLTAEGFTALSAEADTYIETHGVLNGLMIVTEEFPGWEDASGFLSHLKFVREHHKLIKKVGIVSSSPLLNALPSIASHFVAAEIKEFVGEAEAMAWIG